MTETARRTDGRLVPLLRGHRRGHGPRLARRRRGGRRRGPRAARPARPSGVGPAVRGGHPWRHRLHPCGRGRRRRRGPHPRGHRGTDRAGGAAGAGGSACAVRVRLAGLRRVGTAPAPGRAGPLPRGRRARRGHRRRRDRSRARGARGRRGERLGGGDGERDRAQRPRVAPQPGPGHRPPARGHPGLRAGHPAGAHDPDRSRPPGRVVLLFRGAPRHDRHGVGFRRGRGGDGRPAQLHPGRGRTARSGGPTPAPANQPSCSRPTSTT